MMRRLYITLLSVIATCIFPAILLAGPPPDTGQTVCCNFSTLIPCPQPGEEYYGQDAQYQGPVRSYTKLGHGGADLPASTTQTDGWIMTRDNITGLIWEIKTDDGSIHDKNNNYTWYDSNSDTNGEIAGTPGDGTDTEDFIAALNAASFGGFSDWRLPTANELSSLAYADKVHGGPAIDTAWFPLTESSDYWSSTTFTGDTGYALRVGFSNSSVLSSDKSYRLYVRAVRSGQPEQSGPLVDNGDGTVTDTNTGLMWQKATAPGTYYWSEALAYAEELALAGHSDWRLPDRNELQTLVDYSRFNPAIDPLLASDTVSPYYWSSTNDLDTPGSAGITDFHNGFTGVGSKSNIKICARAVRGQVGPLVDNEDGTVTDTNTGLMWQKATAPGTYNWAESLAYAEGLALAGHSDWRLPDRNELQTLVDQSRYNPSVVPLLASDTESSCYWSSTALAGDPDPVWFVDFNNGSVDAGHKSNSFYVRVVRSEQPVSSGSVILAFSVYNSITGDPLPEATINVGSETGQTNTAGEGKFLALPTGIYAVKISKDGFCEYNTQLVLTYSGTDRLRFGLTPIATVSHSNPVVLDVTSLVSSRNREAFFLDGVTIDPIQFTASVNWNGNTPKEIRFKTPNNTVVESAAGPSVPHLFNMGGDFGPGGRLEVVAVSEDGLQSEPFDANIEVMPYPPGWLAEPALMPNFSHSGFSYGGELSVEIPINGDTPIPADIPFFGGKPLDFNFNPKASAVIGSDGSAEYKLSRPHESKFTAGDVSFDKGWSYEGKISLHYDKSDHSWHFDGGNILAGVSMSRDIGPSYTSAVIDPLVLPVYLRGDFKLGVNLDVGVTGFDQDAGWQFDGTTEPSLRGKTITGFGVANVLATEGALGAEVAVKLGWPQDPTFRESGIGLSGSIALVTLFYTYEKPLWEYTWKWPVQSEPYNLAGAMEVPTSRDLQSVEWKAIPRNYTDGISAARSAMSADRAIQETSFSAIHIQTLPGQTGIYPQSTPSLTYSGSSLIATWISDDLTKTDTNRTSLVYSVYSSGQWSTPGKVAEDGTSDFYPVVVSLSDGAMVAWQNTGAVLDSEADINLTLSQQEIAICRYDNSGQAWSASFNMTANNYLDRSPQLSGVTDHAALVWIANTQNDMLGSSDKPNTLMAAFYNGGAWSFPNSVASFTGAILKSALSYDGKQAVYVFAGDGDSDVSTVGDQELYKTVYNGSTWSPIVSLTQDTVQDVNPQLAMDSSQNLLLFWYKDGDFMMATNLDMANSQTVVGREPMSGASDFRLVAGDSGRLFLIWPDASSRGQDIFMTMYDPAFNTWSEVSQITDTDSMQRSLAAAQSADGALALLFNNVSVEYESRAVQVGDNILSVQAPTSGAVDLCMATVKIESDLEVSDASMVINPEQITLGQTVTINATIKNAGMTTLENIAVEFYYDDPSSGSGGTLIDSRQTIAEPLAGGASTDVTVYWTVPADVDSTKAIYVVADPEMTAADANRTNNTAYRYVFKPDLKISQMNWQAVGPVKRALSATVVNSGTVAAVNIPVVFRKGNDESGTILYDGNIASLAAGETVDVTFEWDMTDVGTTDGYQRAFASVNSEKMIDETTYLNNNRIIQVPGALPAVVPGKPPIVPGTTDVPLMPLLSWDAVPGATTYDLYLWQDGAAMPQIPMAAGLTVTQYQLMQSLMMLTTYHWRIVSKNDSGAMYGEIWTFTTKEIITADINDDGVVDLTDAVMALKALAGEPPGQMIYAAANVNGDGTIGLAEVIYALQRSAGLQH